MGVQNKLKIEIFRQLKTFGGAMPNKTRPYREALLEALADPIEAAHYLSVALDDSPEMFRKACLNVIQARKVAKIAKDVGVTRESLYRSFSASGNPSQDTVDSVLDALNLEYAGIRPKRAVSLPNAPVPLAGIPVGFRRNRRRRRRGGHSAQQLSFSYENVPSYCARPNAAISTSTASLIAVTRKSTTIWRGAIGQIQQRGAGEVYVTGGSSQVASVPPFVCAAQNATAHMDQSSR